MPRSPLRPLARLAPLLLVALLLVPSRPPAGAEEPLAPPDQVSRVRVELVQVFVTVVDRQGNPISDLDASDFVLSEDGRPQEIAVFEPPDRSARSAAAPASPPSPGEPASAAGAAPAAPTVERRTPSEGRTYIVVFDSHTNPNGLRFKKAKEATMRFLDERFLPGDRMAVVEMRPQVRVLCDLSSSKEELAAAIRKAAFLPSAGASDGLMNLLTDAINNTGTVDTQRATSRMENLARFNQMLEQSGQREFYDNLAGLAQGVARLPGRKYVLLFSGGFPFLRATEQIKGYIDPMPFPFRELVNEMARTNTAIYTMDIGDETFGADVERADNLRIQMARVGIDENTLEYLGLDGLAYGEDPGRNKQTLAVLAGETGGRFVSDPNYDNALDSIDRELQAAYTLGYYPRQPVEDGRFRRIKVKVPGRPLLQIQHRTGYFSPKPYGAMDDEERRLQLADAAEGRFERQDLPMESRVGFLPGEGGGTAALVTLDVPLRGLQRRSDQEGGGYMLDVVLLAHDASGKLVDSISKQVDAKLDPSSLPPADGGLRLIETLTFPPGEGSLRLVVRDSEHGAMTTEVRSLEVPDYRYDKLALTNLYLMTAGGEYQVVDVDFLPASSRARMAEEARLRSKDSATPPPPPALNPFRLPDGGSFVPTPQRTFHAGEDLFVFMQVLNLETSEEVGSPLLSVTFDLKDRKTGHVRLPAAQEALVVDGAANRPCTVVYRLGLEGLDAGDYALRVTILDKVANAAVQSSEPIRIEPSDPHASSREARR